MQTINSKQSSELKQFLQQQREATRQIQLAVFKLAQEPYERVDVVTGKTVINKQTYLNASPSQFAQTVLSATEEQRQTLASVGVIRAQWSGEIDKTEAVITKLLGRVGLRLGTFHGKKHNNVQMYREKSTTGREWTCFFVKNEGEDVNEIELIEAMLAS